MNATQAGENDRSRGYREPRGENPSPPTTGRKISGFTHAIKRQFREIATLLGCEAPAPQPKKRRSREDTGRAAFRMAAGKILRREVGIPAAAYAAAIAFLSDTLDWLNPWHHDTANTGELNQDFHHAEQNHLSPHL